MVGYSACAGHRAGKIVNHYRQQPWAHMHTWPGISASRCTAHKVQEITQWSTSGLFVEGIGHSWAAKGGASQAIGSKCPTMIGTASTMHDSTHGESSAWRTKVGGCRPGAVSSSKVRGIVISGRSWVGLRFEIELTVRVAQGLRCHVADTWQHPGGPLCTAHKV